ncbi:hypothetical protein J7406_19500 [Ruegeria sp. R8_2]|nr:hypothetical protein [Ruegeria sp. R8_1]MBO9417719.1 hypothetical protein [Ruegeria sp. R8_2]
MRFCGALVCDLRRSGDRHARPRPIRKTPGKRACR